MKYKGKTIAEWAQELGMTKAGMRLRVEMLGSVEAAVRAGINKKPRRIYEGKGVGAWADELGMSRQALHQRIQRCGSLEAAVRRGQRRAVLHWLYCGKGLAEWAVELGVSVGYIQRRMKIAGSLEGAVALCRATKRGPLGGRGRIRPPHPNKFRRGTLKEAAARCGVSASTIRIWRCALATRRAANG